MLKSCLLVRLAVRRRRGDEGLYHRWSGRRRHGCRTIAASGREGPDRYGSRGESTSPLPIAAFLTTFPAGSGNAKACFCIRRKVSGPVSASEVRVGNEVLAIDREHKLLCVRNLKTGQDYSEPYDYLVLSPGAYPLVPKISGNNSPMFMTLRDIPDMDAVMARIQRHDVRSAVVIGAGFIGLEIAENLVARGYTDPPRRNARPGHGALRSGDGGHHPGSACPRIDSPPPVRKRAKHRRRTETVRSPSVPGPNYPPNW